MQINKEDLRHIPNWNLIGGKDSLLEGFADTLSPGETILDLLEGFYLAARHNENGSGIPGVLSLTDRRLFFIQNGERVGSPVIIDLRNILYVQVKQSARSTRIVLSIEGDRRGGVFSATRIDLLVDPFIKLLQEHVDEDSIQIERIETKRTTQSSSEEQLANLNFLLVKARSIAATIADYRNFPNEPALLGRLIEDILCLATLCLETKMPIPDESKLIVAMVYFCLRQQIPQSMDIARRILSVKSLTLRLRREILQRWDIVYNEIRKSKMFGGKQVFISLDFLANSDKRANRRDFDTVSSCFFTFAQLIIKASGDDSSLEQRSLEHIRLLIYRETNRKSTSEKRLRDKSPTTVRTSMGDSAETLEQVMEEIDALIGMDSIKKQIRTFVNLVKMHSERKRRGLPNAPFSKHAVFYGPPGTGKTTIARFLGRVYRCMGLLKKGHLIETDRAGLVAGYVGQTAIQTDELIQQALDGVLFIDEAYTLSQRHGEKDFGQEAIEVLLKRMEDYRDQLVVIVAGYPDEMKQFIESNPGLKSRFSRYFSFDHYTPGDLLKIFLLFSNAGSFRLTPAARKKLRETLQNSYDHRDRSFGNGRHVRNLFEQIIERQANRISRITPLTNEILCSITKRDIPDQEYSTQPPDGSSSFI